MCQVDECVRVVRQASGRTTSKTGEPLRRVLHVLHTRMPHARAIRTTCAHATHACSPWYRRAANASACTPPLDAKQMERAVILRGSEHPAQRVPLGSPDLRAVRQLAAAACLRAGGARRVRHVHLAGGLRTLRNTHRPFGHAPGTTTLCDRPCIDGWRMGHAWPWGVGSPAKFR